MRTWSIVIYLAARVAGDGLYNAASNVVSLTADKANTALTQLPDKSSDGFVLVDETPGAEGAPAHWEPLAFHRGKRSQWCFGLLSDEDVRSLIRQPKVCVSLPVPGTRRPAGWLVAGTGDEPAGRNTARCA